MGSLEELMELSYRAAMRTLLPGEAGPLLESIGLHECRREAEGRNCGCPACDADRRAHRPEEPAWEQRGDEREGPRWLAEHAHEPEWCPDEDTSGGRGAVRPPELRQFNNRSLLAHPVTTHEQAMDVLAIHFSRLRNSFIAEIRRVIEEKKNNGRAVMYVYTTATDGKKVPEAKLFVLSDSAVPVSMMDERLGDANAETGLIFIG